jgi:N-hydroxyarylamine O-acetyltransferase
MEIEAYLKRIHYSGDLTPSLDMLRHLQEAHLYHIPFENLDIHYHHAIVLNVESFYQKIVLRGRGGFCYELNGLFHTLLVELGFRASIISARVYDSQSRLFGNEFDHLAIIVTIDQKEYLVDVGFGEFALHPLEMETNILQEDPRGNFIIQEYIKKDFLVSKMDYKSLIPQYSFSGETRSLNEFTGMCNYHQTSPDSHFTQKKLISRPTEKGRITISGATLKITEADKTIEETRFEENEFEQQVQKWFGIKALTQPVTV